MPPLTYLSNSAILQYLPIHKRREMSKKIPNFRVANRKIPYRLNMVSIYIDHKYISLSFDYYDIKYFCKNGKIIRSTPLNRDADDDVLPEDIEIRNKLLKKLLKYFFNRQGTRVDLMTFGSFDDDEWCQQNDFNDIQLKIGTLYLLYLKSNKHCTMELFKNTQFSEIDIPIYDLEDIDRIKSFNRSRNVHYNITVNDSDRIDLQSLIGKLDDNKIKYTLELGYDLFKTFLQTLKTSRSYPLGLTVKSSTGLSQSHLKNIGGVESFVTKDCEIQCYTFPTSDPQKEVIVTWEKDSIDGFPFDIYNFEATVQKSGASIPCLLTSLIN